MERHKFVFRVVIAFGSLAGFYFAYPWILSVLIELSSCRGIGGACGAFATVISVYVRPPVIIAFAAFLLWVLVKRMRWLDISRGWAVLVGLWLLGSFPFLVAFGNFWAANFSLGLVYLSLPVTLLFLLVFILFLVFADDNPARSSDPVQKRAWLIAKVSAGYVLLLSATSLYIGLSSLPVLSVLRHPELGGLIGKLVYFSIFGQKHLYLVLLWCSLAVFAAALLLVVIRQSRDGDTTPPIELSPSPAPVKPKVPRSFGRRKYT